MMIHMDDHTCRHSANRLRTDVQRMAANILVGRIENNLLFCVFLLLSSAIKEEEKYLLFGYMNYSRFHSVSYRLYRHGFNVLGLYRQLELNMGKALKLFGWMDHLTSMW